MRTITRQIGLGMIQQMNTVCPECRGSGMLLLFHLCVSSCKMRFAWAILVIVIMYPWSGEIISERDRCPSCRASKVVQERKVLEVHIEKGMQHGQKIVFQGEADQAVSSIHPHSCSHKMQDVYTSIELFITAFATINIAICRPCCCSLTQCQETLFSSCKLKSTQDSRGDMMTCSSSTQSLWQRLYVDSSSFWPILMVGSF